MAMELTTRCPQCETVFSVSLEQLQLRKGYIRCIQCAHIFDGFEAVVPNAASTIEPSIPPLGEAAPATGVFSGHDARGDDASEPPAPRIYIGDAPAVPAASGPTPAQPFTFGPDPESPAVSSHSSHSIDAPPMPSVVRQRGDRLGSTSHDGPAFTISSRRAPAGRRNEPVFGAAERASGGRGEPSVGVSGAASPAEDATVESQRDDTLVIESRPGRRVAAPFDGPQPRRGWMTLVWVVLILCGLAGLVAQGAYVYRAQLANAFPALRPALEAACEQVSCTVPYERHINAIAITGSALRSNGAPEADVSTLTLEITLRNTHERPQEWPTLVLDLKDASGTVVVRRNLDPDVWVPAELRNGPFGAGAELTVQIPVAVRGLMANGYQLDKFFP